MVWAKKRNQGILTECEMKTCFFLPLFIISLFSWSCVADRFWYKQLHSQIIKCHHQGLLGSSSSSGNDCCKLRLKPWKEETVLWNNYSASLVPTFPKQTSDASPCKFFRDVCQCVIDLFKTKRPCAFALLYQLGSLHTNHPSLMPMAVLSGVKWLFEGEDARQPLQSAYLPIRPLHFLCPAADTLGSAFGLPADCLHLKQLLRAPDCSWLLSYILFFCIILLWGGWSGFVPFPTPCFRFSLSYAKRMHTSFYTHL